MSRHQREAPGGTHPLLPQPTIVNRLQLDLDDYQGLMLTTLTTSPDGTVFQDVLQDLRVSTISLDGTSGAYSGDVILDFPPRHVQKMRLVLTDRVGEARIALRSVGLSFRRYGDSGRVVTGK